MPNEVPFDLADRIVSSEAVAMKYVRVAWVLFYSEVDMRNFEVRKVEVFRDGRYGYASALESSGGTKLGSVAMP